MPKTALFKSKNSPQKSILTLVLAICPVLAAQQAPKGVNLAHKQAFATQDIKALEDLCLQELNLVLKLTGQGDDISNLNKLVKGRVTGIYKQLIALANGLVKNGDINKAIALLNGLYSKIHEYTDSTAWDRLIIQASTTLQAKL